MQYLEAQESQAEACEGRLCRLDGEGDDEPNNRIPDGEDRKTGDDESWVAFPDQRFAGSDSESVGAKSSHAFQLSGLLSAVRLLRKFLERSKKREEKYKRELAKLELSLSYAQNDGYGDRHRHLRYSEEGGSAGRHLWRIK